MRNSTGFGGRQTGSFVPSHTKEKTKCSPNRRSINFYLLKSRCKTSVPLWTKTIGSLISALAGSNNQADTAPFHEILPTHKIVPYV